MSRPEHVIVDELDPKEKGLTIGDYLKDNYKNKTIGKEAVPYIKPIVDSIGSAYTDTMRDARHGLLGPHSFVGAHALNFAGKVIPDIPIDKGIKHALHEWGGVDEYLSGVAGEGAEIALTRKALNKVSKLKPKDLGITTKTEKINTLSRGKKMWNITKDIDEIIVKANPSYIRKASELYKHHEGGITWKQAMEMAKLPSWENRTVYIPPNERIGTQKGDPLQSVNPDQLKLFDLPTDPAGKEALRIFSEDLAVRSGYESMAKFKKEVLNRWPQKDQDQLFRELWSNQQYQGYIEHLTAKGSHMDWYWNMKGKDRNAVDNVRILYNDNLKNLKDTVEKIVYGTPNNPGLGWEGESLENRLIVSFEDPQRKTKKLYSRQNPGDIVIKRAGNDKIIGNLGQYLDTLYPQDPLAKRMFEDGVAKLGLTPAQFRRQILTERIGIIIENSYGLPKNATKRKRYIKQFIDDDMVDLTTQYSFLQSKQSISEAINKPGSGVTEADYDKRGQGKNPIPPLGDPKFTKGPFPSKTEMMNIEKAKRKGYIQGSLNDFLEGLFPKNGD